MNLLQKSLFHSLNRNLNIQLFLLLLLTGWAGWTIFTRMTIIPPDGTMLLFQYITKLWAWNSLVVRIAVLLIVLITTIGLIQHFQKDRFSENRTYMPGVFLLALLNCGKFLYTLTPALITVFFIALIMIMYSPNMSAAKMNVRIFTFGLIIAIATLLDISAFGIVLFLIMLIAINNVTSFKDILIFLSGMAFPYIWAFSISFFCNGDPIFTQSWRDLSIFVPAKSFLGLRIIDYVAMGWFIFATFILMIRDKKLLDNKLIVIRRAFNNVNLLLFSMLVFLWLGIVPLPMALLYLLLPVSHYMSIAVSQKRSNPFVDLLIISKCLLLWF